MAGRHGDAQESYRRALAASPGLVAANNNLGMSLLLSGRAADAVAVLEPLASRPDAPARVRNNLAVAQAAAGDRNRARAMLSQREGADDLDGLVSALRPPG